MSYPRDDLWISAVSQLKSHGAVLGNRLQESITASGIAFASQTTAKLHDLLKKMLHKDPTKRLGHHSAKEIKEHPWFAELHW